MSRILIDLSEMQISELAALVDTQRRPRAAIVRDAIDAYIAAHKSTVGTEIFGLWKGKKVDGLAYQQALRSEW